MTQQDTTIAALERALQDKEEVLFLPSADFRAFTDEFFKKIEEEIDAQKRKFPGGQPGNINTN